MNLGFLTVLCVCAIVSAVASDGVNNGVDCGPNEVYNACGSLCVATCNARHFGNCAQQCNPACFCEDGYIRSAIGGPCVKVSECRFHMGKR